MVKIVVDTKEIRADDGRSILQTCLEHGIFIPNLCFMKSREHPHASCRLCFVEIDGIERPVTSCTESVREGLVVWTATPKARRLQRTGFKLLMSAHHCQPKACPVRGGCQLIRIARYLNVSLNSQPLERLERAIDEEVDLGLFTYYPFRCVLCGRCVHVCRQRTGHNLLTFARRGLDTVVALFGGADLAAAPCRRCGACATVCPTGALVPKWEHGKAASAGSSLRAPQIPPG
jgi:predicted molibdopterin-dependent oxidoreductase YjgC